MDGRDFLGGDAVYVFFVNHGESLQVTLNASDRR
jgi:hypothetical protein